MSYSKAYYISLVAVVVFTVTTLSAQASTVVDIEKYPTISIEDSTIGPIRNTVSSQDYNGDGITDILIEIYNYNSSNEIIAIVQQGSLALSGSAVDISADTTFTSTATEVSVSLPLGDINSDGFADMAFTGVNTDNEVQLYIWYGQSELSSTVDLDTESDAIITATDTDNTLYIAAGDDLTGDGNDDIILTETSLNAYGYSGDQILHIIPGTAGSDPVSGNVTLEDIPHTALVNDGESLIGLIFVLNFNDDAYPDFLATAVNLNDQTARFELFYGGADLATAFNLETPDITMSSTAGAMNSVNDVNADGIDDIAITNNASDGFSIMLGRSTDNAWSGEIDPEEDMDFNISDEDANVIVPASYPMYGYDYNNDGIDDLVFKTAGDTYTTGYNNGKVDSMRVLFGGTDIATRAESIEDDDIRFIGATLESSGDIDGDSKNDFVILDQGVVRIMFGSDNDNDGYSGTQGDCRNKKSKYHPGKKDNAPDFKDNNCDGAIDEGYTYSFKKNGPLKRIKQKKNYWEFTYQDNSKQRLNIFFGGGGPGTLRSITPDGKYIVTTYSTSLLLIDAYTGNSVVNKKYIKKYNNYAKYADTIALTNPTTGDALVVLAHKLRNKRTTRILVHTITRKGTLKRTQKLFLDGTVDATHALQVLNDKLDLSIENTSYATYTFTQDNTLERF